MRRLPVAEVRSSARLSETRTWRHSAKAAVTATVAATEAVAGVVVADAVALASAVVVVRPVVVPSSTILLHSKSVHF